MIRNNVQVEPLRGSSPVAAPATPEVSTIEPASVAGRLAAHQSVIGRGLILTGEITGDSLTELLIEGTVEGAINLPGTRIAVGPGGQVNSTICAANVVVSGKVTGSVTATERIEIRVDGRLNGDAEAPRIRIEDGAFVVGKILVTKAAKAKVSAVASTDVQEAAWSSVAASETAYDHVPAETPWVSPSNSSTPMPIEITAFRPGLGPQPQLPI